MTQVLHGITHEFSHGRAFSVVEAVENPAAGGGFTYLVSGNYWERFDSICFKLTTDGTAGNRRVSITYKDGSGKPIARVVAGANQAATLAYIYSSWITGAAPGALQLDTLSLPLPDLFLQPGFTIVVDIDTVKAGDQISDIRLGLERYDTGPEGYPIGMVDETAATARAERRGE